VTDNLQLLFQSRVRDAGGWCEIVESGESACSLLQQKCTFEKNETVVSGRVTQLLNCSGLSGVNIESVKPDDRRILLAGSKLGITTCDGLIADTGTAILVNHPSEPRELSLLPERHIVVAMHDWIYPSLDECLRNIIGLYPSGATPSMTLISGPSRTSDIEKTLVTGVHGPKEFGVVIVGVSD
jgi:L-lactate dehydrogenase complex protein LldG